MRAGRWKGKGRREVGSRTERREQGGKEGAGGTRGQEQEGQEGWSRNETGRAQVRGRAQKGEGTERTY